MACKRRITALAISLAVLGCAKTAETLTRPWPQVLDIKYGTPPPASAVHWIRISDIGPRDSPPAIVWFFPTSPGEYDRFGWEHVVVLSSDKYDSLADFVQANHCATDIGKNTDLFAKQISEYSGGKVETLCVLPCDKIHPYVVRMLAVLGINPANSDAKTIGMLDRETCERIPLPTFKPLPE